MNFSSNLIEEAVNAFASLPGVGRKSALRHVLFLIKQPIDKTEKIASALVNLKQNLKTCIECFNVSDSTVCAICTNPRRDKSVVMVVENIRDVMAIENTSLFNGVYHILGGVISPMEGIGPNDINANALIRRVNDGNIKEIIMAISPTIEGETTIFYLSRQLKEHPVKITTLARGISFGSDLEYTDETTLGRSIQQRVDYNVQNI